MFKLYKKVKFFIKVISLFFLSKILFFFVNKKYILIGSSVNNKDLFLNNTKYLFLYLSKNNNFKTYYVCNNKKTKFKLREKGYNNVCLRNSIKALFLSLKAKFWFFDFYSGAVYPFANRNAKLINLWHGIPLKKMGYDDVLDNRYKYKTYEKIFYNYYSDKYCSSYITNSSTETKFLSSCFGVSDNHFKIIGSPRLDVLLHDIPNSDIFMEKDFSNIKLLSEQGKKLFIYMPTFRDSGKDISGWLKSDKLKQFLKDNNAVLVCKLHPFDKNSLDFKLTEDFYKMDSDSDIYPVLKYSDALITDYSSVYFDYLLLDKPILYYPIDLEEYESTRGFYASYEELTAGVKTYKEDELISAMQDVIDGKDEYKEQRKQLRDRMFTYQDGKNCERIVEWIKSLE